MAGYAGGRIKKIKIRNFMTYDNVELYPKKGLNLIIGLNGSGKSSIMCAICLGLAGRPQFTGRATQLSDFIKHGCKEAEIEIELEKTKGSLLIHRKIKSDRCEWLLNNSASNQNEVATAVKQFNIDTSNLCQFLPQEKVVEFSRMDKKQRLENMLQAIGEPHLFQLFNELKDSHRQFDDVQLEIKRFQAKKGSAEEENERISDEVHKQENRVRLKKELEELSNQNKILNYLTLCEEVKKLKEKAKNLEKELETVKEEQKEANALESSIFKSYLTYVGQQQQLDSQKREVVNKITTGSNTLASLKEQVENVNIEYKNRLKEADNEKKRLHDLKKQIEGLEQALREEKLNCVGYEEHYNLNIQNLTQLQQDLNPLYREIEKALAEKGLIDYSIAENTRQLSALQNEHNKKMENLKRRDKFTYQAACWLLENRNTFKSNIYLPIMLEIKVHSSTNCKYIESTIPFRDMIAFVCEDKSDCERFTDIMAQKELPVNVVMVPEIPLSSFKSPPLTSEYKECGLECYVSDLFTAPEPVMKYLYSCCGIHRIPVASSHVPANRTNFVLQKYKVFFSENFRVTGKKSRYGDHNWSERRDFVMEQNLLTVHNDDLQRTVLEKLQTLQREKLSKAGEMEKLESRRKVLEEEQERLRQEKKRLQDMKKRIDNNEFNYQQKLKLLSHISLIDVKEERVKVARKIASINEHRENTVGQLNQLLKEFICIEKKILKAMLCINSLSTSLKLTKASNEEVHERVKNVEVALANASREHRERKVFGRALYKELEVFGKTTNMGLTAEQIEQKINHIQAKLNVDEDNEPVVADYKARKEKIEDFQSQINNLSCTLEEIKENLQHKKTQWLTPLLKHIGNINKRFSRYFKQLNCAGEINVDIPDNPDDFEKYGLQIKLKYRDEEPLTELSQTRHSGGECSVAAIVFILSLQELTEVPFRCIDEINQGMDSVNERKIYQLIADSVGKDRCSQYFLLTPKLLTDLQYPDDVAVHIIFNSYFLNTKLDTKKHLQIAQSV